MTCVSKVVSIIAGVKCWVPSCVYGRGHLPLIVLLSAASRVPNRCEAAVPVSPRSTLPSLCCHQPEDTTWPHGTVIPVAAVVSCPTRSTLNSQLLAHVSTSGDIRHYWTWIKYLFCRWSPISDDWQQRIIKKRIFWVLTPCLSVVQCRNLHGGVITN